MNDICSLPNPTQRTRRSIQNIKIAIQITMELFYEDNDISILLTRLKINEILNSYYQEKSKN
jgi:hypothetical protein